MECLPYANLKADVSSGMIEAFENPQVNSFSCTSPLDLSASG